MITRVFYSSLFYRASFYLIFFFDKIFYFSIIDGSKTGIDLFLMETILFSSVNHVVRIFNGKKAPKKSTAVTFDWTRYLLTLDSDELFFSYVENIDHSYNWLLLICVLRRNPSGH